jgi:hypothetical protein
VGAGDDLTTLSLDDPKQWSIGWTTFPDVGTLGLPHLNEWAATVDVTQPDKATEAFFPTIARYGRSYNLILPKKAQSPDVGTWRDLFGSAWTLALDAAAKADLLYVIDLRIYETLQLQKVAGFPRFTPSTITVLVQDAATKALTPELIRVAGGDNQPKTFSRQGSTTPSAWVYALQAAKVSVTVYGIWLGHVYQWHIIIAAMVMTMFENLSANHPVRKLLEPQSSYLIPFDDVLLLGWGSLAEAPPTSIATARVLAFERQEIALLRDDALIHELLAYSAKTLPSGLIQYGAPPGSHDDLVMALALAWQAVAHPFHSAAGVRRLYGW